MIIFFLFLNLWGQEPVIQSNQTSNLNYEKYLIEHPTQRSFVDFYINRKDENHQQLPELLKNAQFEFLNGSLDKAKNYFKNITELQHLMDWDQNQRNIIHFSFLRLAQLEENRTLKSKILKQALNFDDDIAIDSTLFPPPLIEEYVALKKQLLYNVWQLPKNHRDFNVLLINGKKHDANSSFIKTTSDKKRFSFLSNTYKPVHLTVNASDLQNTNLPKDELATGPCESPLLQFDQFKIKSFVFIDNLCIKEINSRKVLDFSIPTQSATASNPPSSLFKKKWFWIGTSILLSGIIYSTLQSNHSSKSDVSARTPEIQTFTNESD